MHDDALLGTVPDFVSFGTMLKARPATEGNERFIYVEASREAKDQQGEIVLAKALQESAQFFTKFGNIDLDHKSMPSVAAKYGIECPEEWAVGVPVDVRFDGNSTFVKGRLYTGDTPLAVRANMVWDGLTKLNPPRRYYASVGGAVLAKSVHVAESGERTPVITRTRWSNLALTEQPVLADLDSPASTTPIGVFSKSMGGWVVSKSLTAGYGSDSATLTGGSALRGQSLDRRMKQVIPGGTSGPGGSGPAPATYLGWREHVSKAIRDGKISIPNAEGLIDYSAKNFGLQLSDAAEYVERFLRDPKTGLMKRSNTP